MHGWRAARLLQMLAGVRVVKSNRGAGQAIAVLARGWRKVRAPADRVPGNAWGARAHGKCNRE